MPNDIRVIESLTPEDTSAHYCSETGGAGGGGEEGVGGPPGKEVQVCRQTPPTQTTLALP